MGPEAVVIGVLCWLVGWFMARSIFKHPPTPPPQPQLVQVIEKEVIRDRVRFVNADNYTVIKPGGRMFEVRYEPVAYPVQPPTVKRIGNGWVAEDDAELIIDYGGTPVVFNADGSEWRPINPAQLDSFSHRELSGHPNYRLINGTWYYKHM